MTHLPLNKKPVLNPVCAQGPRLLRKKDRVTKSTRLGGDVASPECWGCS